jgi:hypothetical protein
MSGGADLKENAILAFERDFAVIQPPGGVHQAESADELLGVEALEESGGRGWRGG